MMTWFYQADSFSQNVLLVISQITMISLAAGFILLFKRKCSYGKIILMGLLLLLNAAAYVLMQLDSRLTGGEQGLKLPIPWLILLVLTLSSLGGSVWLLLSETKNRKTISQRSIKEAFDNLPTAVCFFNEAGLPVLCNLAMQRFSFAVCGKDVQYLTDLESLLSDSFIPLEGVRKEGGIFIFPEGKTWQLRKRSILHEKGERYTQYIASEITDLYSSRVALQQENEELRKVQNALKKLSANVVAVTREEEILNAKMRVHDEMGRCLVAAQKYLREDSAEPIPDSLALSWQRAVATLKYSNETPDEDMLLQIRKTCDFVKLAFVQRGALPRQEAAAYLLTCAVRECVTNAVRYAGATELYADFSENEREATVSITNNGKAPEGEIREGGGLSTLRRRVERAGGTMAVASVPIFRLTVTVPKEKEGIL